MRSVLPIDEASSNGPVYRQIAGRIRTEIKEGGLAEGSRLPTIRGLAGELGVNRDTVALAYELLSNEGLVESVVGRGTFVRGSGGNGSDPESRVELSLATPVEQLLSLEKARPRFGVGGRPCPSTA